MMALPHRLDHLRSSAKSIGVAVAAAAIRSASARLVQSGLSISSPRTPNKAVGTAEWKVKERQCEQAVGGYIERSRKRSEKTVEGQGKAVNRQLKVRERQAPAAMASSTMSACIV